MKTAYYAGCLLLAAPLAFGQVPEKNERQPEQTSIEGFTDTPMQPPPNQQWHIHDPNRPQPEVAKPKYKGKPVPPPKGTTVLFDGTSLNKWSNKNWKLENGAMIASSPGDTLSTELFGDGHYHVEWMVPAGLKGFDQKQGNSGVFIMNRYEIQVLNCWANRTYPDGTTGAVYGQTPPLVNACRKPGEWQTFDVIFFAPVFEGDKLVKSPRVTVFHNGLLAQFNEEIRGETNHRVLPQFKAKLNRGPVKLAGHHCPVRFRNIWVRPL